MHKTLGSLVAIFNPVFGNGGEMELTTKHSTIPWQYICLHSSCCTICDLCENVEYLFALSFSFNLKNPWIDSSPQIKVVFIYSPQIAISDICKLINLKKQNKNNKKLICSCIWNGCFSHELAKKGKGRFQILHWIMT